MGMVSEGRVASSARPFHLGRLLPWACCLLLMAAELLVAGYKTRAGMELHLLIYLAIIALAVFCWQRGEAGGAAPSGDAAADAAERPAGNFGYNFYLALSLAPMIRVCSLAVPLRGIPPVFWYLVVALPVFAASFVVMRQAGYRAGDISLTGIALKRVPVSALVALSGIGLGWLEYQILRPAPLVPSLDFRQVLLPGLILIVFTGFLEELVFRGIMQKASDDYLGRSRAWLYVSLVFAVLHITHRSWLDVVFVFAVACYFSLVVKKTGSLWGVTLAHGLTNVSLYLYWPLLIGAGRLF